MNGGGNTLAATTQLINETKMLIADDDPAVVRLLADRFTKMGFSIETAGNGMQALFKAKRNSPDILVVDINMPQIDGLALCNRLLEPANRPCNVIVITGSRDEEIVERCTSMGAYYVCKDNEFWTELSSALSNVFPDMADAINEQAAQSPQSNVQNRPRVLLIDDDPSMEGYFSSRLGKKGVDLLFASDAIHGYRMACREEPSVVITDYHMPNGDAYYLLWRMRTTLETKNIPVIVLTGLRLTDADKSNLRRDICNAPGAAKIFSKATDIDELFASLQEFCGFDNH
jgi:CheY-like chemotaxis protein